MDQRPSVPLRLTVGARSGLGEFRAEVRSWIGHSAGGPEIDDIVLACGEAVDNALEHGTPPASVEMGWEDDGLLTIIVRDAGTWSVSTQLPPRGLGLPIMMALMDNVTVDTTNGTAIRLSRRF